MPTSVIAAAIVSSFAASATGIALSAAIGATAFAAVSAIATFVISSGLKMLIGGGGQKKQHQQQQPVTQAAQSRQQIVRSPVAVRQIIYGQVQASGALLYAESSEDNNTLHLIIATAGHEIEAIDTFFLNDRAVGALDGNGEPTGGEFAGLARFRVHDGATGQAADSALISESPSWTTNDRLDGVAYAYARLQYDSDAFPTGIPNIKFKVTGKKLFDVRTSTTAYSNNPALVAYDYLVNYFKADASSIDIASFIAAANICDEAVPLAEGGTEPRYTCNGLILTEVTHRDAMDQILTSCGGNITVPQGAYRLNVAAYTAPVLEIDETYLRGGMKVKASVSKKVLYNAVTGTYVNPANFWQATDLPITENALYATEDGEQIIQDIQLPFTTSSPTGQRLAKIMLEKSRQGIGVEMPCNLKAMQIRPFDNITLSIAYLGWASKVFKVIAMNLYDNGAVDLVLQEEAESVYDWNSGDETLFDLAPNTNLPNAFFVPQPGNVQLSEEIYQTTGSAGVKAKAIMTWEAPADSFVIDYEVEFKLSTDSEWIEVFNIRGLLYEFFDLAPGTYDFRVKARNIVNVVSEYTAPVTFEVMGLTADPADVQNFTVSVFNGQATGRWDLTNDLDVKIGGKVVIRSSPLTVGGTWEQGTIFGEFTGDTVTAPLPLITGTYFIKFVDSTGHFSITATSFLVSEDLISGWTTVATVTENPAFLGDKTNVFLDGINLELTGSLLWDDFPDFDAEPTIDYAGGIASSGVYSFTSTLDLSTVATRRFHAHLKTESYVATDDFDLRTDDMDSWSDFDNVTNINDCNARLETKVSDDDISYTEWTPFNVDDFSCRYAQFRAILNSGDPTHNIHVPEISVSVKIPT